MKNPLIKFSLIFLGIVSVTFFSGCDRRSDSEKAADEMEEAVEEVGKAVSDAVEDIGKAIKKAE